MSSAVCLKKITEKLQEQESNLWAASCNKHDLTGSGTRAVANLGKNRLWTRTTIEVCLRDMSTWLNNYYGHAKLHPDYIRTKNLNRSGRKADFCDNSIVMQGERLKNRSCVSAMADSDLLSAWRKRGRTQLQKCTKIVGS